MQDSSRKPLLPFLQPRRSRSTTTSSIQSVNSTATITTPTTSNGTYLSPRYPDHDHALPSTKRQKQMGSDHRRPSLLSVRSLSRSGSGEAVTTSDNARGIAYRSRTLPSSYKTSDETEDWGRRTILSPSPLSSPLSPKGKDQLEAIESVSNDTSRFPGYERRTPSEEALLHSLETDVKKDGNRTEELTLRTFTDSSRTATPTVAPDPQPVAPVIQESPERSKTLTIQRPDTSSINLSADDLSKSLGRHSLDSFRTARATLPIDQTDLTTASSVTEEEEVKRIDPVAIETDDQAIAQVGLGHVGPREPGLGWGAWLYGAVPTLRRTGVSTLTDENQVGSDTNEVQAVGHSSDIEVVEAREPGTVVHENEEAVVSNGSGLDADDIEPIESALDSVMAGEVLNVEPSGGKSDTGIVDTVKPEPVDTDKQAVRGWTGYLRSWVVGNQVKPSPGPSSIDAGHSDQDLTIAVGPSSNEALEEETTPTPAVLPTPPMSSSRWWSASRVPTDTTVKQTEPDLDPVKPSEPIEPPSTVDPGDKLAVPDIPPPRSERRQSSITRKSLVLPSWNATFDRPPRLSTEPIEVEDDQDMSASGTLWRELIPGFHKKGASGNKTSSMDDSERLESENNPLPRAVYTGKESWAGIRRVVIIGVHGWFPNTHVQRVVGAPRTSGYFCSMMGQAVLSAFEETHGVAEEQLDKLTYIPLDGEGRIGERIEKLYNNYLNKPEWIAAVRSADAIFITAHSQGCIVAAHILARLVVEGHIRTQSNEQAVEECARKHGAVASQRSTGHSRSTIPVTRRPKVALLSMCGVNLGPFYNAAASTVMAPYLWFEHPAARELFDLQDSSLEVSKQYQESLASILDHGVKVILLGSLDDQMVPIYSACYTTAHHPLLLRLLYVDSTISPAHDFIINLIVFGLMMLNAGLDDQGLISHLSEATAGAWRGVGHSTPYEDAGPYAYMVKYLLSTDSPGTALEPLSVETFVARDAKNDYELPWILRGVMDDPDATVLFQAEIKALKETILSWQPNTRALKDIKKRLEPMAGRAALRIYQQNSRILRSPSALSIGSTEDNDGLPLSISPLAKKSGLNDSLSKDW